MAHRVEAFQKVLTRIGPLQSSTIAQSIAHGHVGAFDSFGRLATCSVQPCPELLSAGAGVRHGLHIWGLSEHYREIFEITRLAEFMPICADEIAALAGAPAAA